MAQVPIIRRKPEGGQDFLLALTITHPDTPEGPQINLIWDGVWAKENNLPPVIAQQVFASALQTLFAGALVVCGNVMAPPQRDS